MPGQHRSHVTKNSTRLPPRYRTDDLHCRRPLRRKPRTLQASPLTFAATTHRSPTKLRQTIEGEPHSDPRAEIRSLQSPSRTCRSIRGSQSMGRWHRKNSHCNGLRGSSNHQCRLCLLHRPHRLHDRADARRHARKRKVHRRGNAPPRLGRPTGRLRSIPRNVRRNHSACGRYRSGRRIH